MGRVDPILKLMSTLPFVAETVVGPYLCRWTFAEGRPAIVFIAPHDGEAVPAVTGSPDTMPPACAEARAA